MASRIRGLSPLMIGRSYLRKRSTWAHPSGGQRETVRLGAIGTDNTAPIPRQHVHVSSCCLEQQRLRCRQVSSWARSPLLQTRIRAHRHRYQASHRPFAASASTVATVAVDDEISHEPEYDETDEQVEQFAAHCMTQLLPPSRKNGSDNRQREFSSLDLELGNGSVWDDPWSHDYHIQEESGDEVSIESDDSNDLSFLRYQPGRKPSSDLLRNFDPQNPPSTDDPVALQLWLECETRLDAVHRYQKVIHGARDRKDYAALSMVQQQILRWFQPLRDEIARLQKEYLLAASNNDKDSKVDKAQKNEKQQKQWKRRYGPYLCFLSPEKIAVIVAHEGIMQALLGSGVYGREGVPFISMARRLGDAVEEEALIHRTLYKRLQLQKTQQQQQDGDNEVEDTTTASDIDNNIRALVLGDVHGSNAQGESASNDTEPSSSGNGGDNDKAQSWAYGESHLRQYLDELSKYEPSAKRRRLVSYAVRRARKIVEKEEWSVRDKIQLGAVLFQILLQNATVVEDDEEEMAFTYEKRWLAKHKRRSFVTLNDRLHRMIVSDKFQSVGSTTTRFKPMILPPKPWTKPTDGGYLWLRTDIVRFHGSNTQKEALKYADLSTVYDGLNALGRVPWQINKRILDVADACWDNNVALGEIPSRDDYVLPPEPIPPERPAAKLDKDSEEYKKLSSEYHTYREALTKYRRMNQKNMDLRSLRCSVMLKLDQAQKFRDFEKIYFPYNMDFRGRAYPVPPHLSNVGSDLSRGMLKFAEAKPLGARGLYWLKVHLANLAGKDKMTFDDRANFVDENMDNVRASIEDPFAGDRWWMGLDDPFQALATCIEIVNAIDSGDPESYECSLAVHMDGSCNGLQHYAALGLDRVGGKAVNLCNYDEPQDVYIGVMHEVIRRVAEEAERQLDFDTSDIDSLSSKQKKEYKKNRAAKLVNGLIDRGVVKRTVMTSVYGVTYIGARTQIQEKVEEKLQGLGHDVDEMSGEIFSACGYLATVTMEVMGDLFTGARATMNWLTTCARLISQHGYPVAWVSPIGIPAIQPYRETRTARLVTLMQTVTLTEDNDDLPIMKQRQCSAFPPNYVHSLDSSHMLLTAIEMDRRGLTFSAVHDSFWTHACDIDEMNKVLRRVFVDLYDQPLLERLRDSWQMRYPDLEFPELPECGELDIHEVKKAPYFFQ